MAKKNNKKQVKTNKVVNKATTPAEEDVKDVDVKEESQAEKVDNKVSAKESKSVKPEKKTSKDKKDSKKSDDKTKKRWFKEFKAELKKVIWPTGKELFNNTAVVLMVVVLVSVLIFILDLAFGALTKFEVKQIEKFKNETSNSIVENATDENQTLGDNNTEIGTTEIDLTPGNN